MLYIAVNKLVSKLSQNCFYHHHQICSR